MAEFDNTNRGSIWKNDRKTTDKHPDFTGSLNVEGVEYFFDAWKRREGAAEKAPALTFKVKRKEQQQSIRQRAMPKRPQNVGEILDDMDGDSIPF